MHAYPTSPLFRAAAIGFDDLFRAIESARGLQGYPHFDIERLDEDRFRVVLAVAGFRESELEVQTREGELTVTGTPGAAEGKTPTLLHRGIARRAFRRTFALAEGVEVTEARLADGLLSIELKRVVPEAKRPRKVAIASAA